MSLRFFGEIVNQEIRLSDDDVFHLTKVLRLRAEEQIEVVANGKLFTCRALSFTPFKLEIINEEALRNELNYSVTLIYVLPKRDKLELALEKAVELGATKIVITTSQYSVVKIKEMRTEAKLTRYQKIIKSAAMQAKRDVLPTIAFVSNFSEALNEGGGIKIIASEHEQKQTFQNALTHQTDVTILIGSEGGFTIQEVKIAEDANYIPVTFGPLILRTETSVIYALSIINNFLRGEQ